MQNIEFTNKSKNGIDIRRNSDYNFLVGKRSNEWMKDVEGGVRYEQSGECI